MGSVIILCKQSFIDQTFRLIYPLILSRPLTGENINTGDELGFT